MIKNASKESGLWSILKINSRNSQELNSVVPDIWSHFLFVDALLESNGGSNTVSNTGSNVQKEEESKSPIKQKASLDSSTSPVNSNTCLVSHSFTFTDIQNQFSSEGIGKRLSQNDFSAIDVLMKDFIVSKVIQFMTNSIRDWERDVASNRRGISARLLKVGLKYFGNGPTSMTGPITDSKGRTM